MRLTRKDLKPYVVKRQIPKKDLDGTTYEGWTEEGHTIQANIQPAGGKLTAEMYGERLAYMMTAIVDPGTDIKETDGVCVFVSSDADPDYKVVAAPVWGSHRVVSLEAIR